MAKKKTSSKKSTKKTGRPAGRPRLPFSPEIFESLCELQCTQKEMAQFLRMSEYILRRKVKEHYGETFSVVYEKKRAGGLISLRRNQFRLAQKNAAMAIFLGKNYLQQADSPSKAHKKQELGELAHDKKVTREKSAAKEDARKDAIEFYRNILEDDTTSMAQKLKAQERLDVLFDLVPQAGTSGMNADETASAIREFVNSAMVFGAPGGAEIVQGKDIPELDDPGKYRSKSDAIRYQEKESKDKKKRKTVSKSQLRGKKRTRKK